VGEAKWGATTEKDLESALQIGPVSINMFADSPMGHYKVCVCVWGGGDRCVCEDRRVL
jgi:hypothetical protein